ncbi:PREDICTED: BOI-related E3 ubiquitin-protein ligase 1-like [Lupinus angustifolius]|uniref:BOI-related E3 ubiquitin-protein ligase 1-like n=1 Tax=Lupinus angustifolius TaxID=3871 RepID=UPI00092F9BE0|nr:PREDICTED: BOI-related E3 ubiquitin-protein ligase 1-like [Lupinus angustifolius]
MAVQAQYPSNVIFLNRNGQEENDCSLQQPQSKGGYTPYNNNNGSANSRKRGREDIVANTTPNNIMNPLFSMQSHTPQLIELSQLHNQHQNVGSIGLGLSFDHQQQQRLQLQQQQQQQQHGNRTSSYLSLSSEGFSLQIKQERDEIDQFLHALGEDLQSTLAARRQRHYQELLRAAEEAVARRLREMEGEVDKATRRNAELEARAAQLSSEAQVWQAKARAHEAAATSLQVQLQQTIIAAGAGRCHGGDDGGAGLSCALDGGQAEDVESAYIDPDRVEVITSAAARAKCRGCEKRVASVVVLPCRHLCMCAGCDAHFRACPVCLTLKDSTVEVHLC